MKKTATDLRLIRSRERFLAEEPERDAVCGMVQAITRRLKLESLKLKAKPRRGRVTTSAYILTIRSFPTVFAGSIRRHR